MARQKLTYTFHNPNSEEETIKYITTLLAESVVHKVENIPLYIEETLPTQAQPA